ncbi:MAG TPA: dicarboxylate/amino acid:cation symporter [Parachlamydiaceae bacterium]|nr:dicarboxylate/amino acid:cation symporter [Parachlamydiaceae bacterium]
MRNHLLLKVFAAIFLAIVAGILAGPNSYAVLVFDLLGKLFLNALTLVVVPLVASSIITGSAKMGSDAAFEKLGFKIVFYFVLNSLTAAFIGLLVVLTISPGSTALLSTGLEAATHLNLENLASTDLFSQFSAILQKIVPPNILDAASKGQMLGLIFFSLLFGFFIPKIEPHAGSIMLSFWKAIFEIMMKITHLLMRAMPIGVFGLVAKVAATMGTTSIASFAWFFLTVSFALGLYMFAVLPLLLLFFGGVNPVAYFKAMGPAIFTALSTSSSAATLPVTIDCMEKRVGVSNRIASFTLPLGTSLNCAGTALYASVAAVYIAQSFGVELTSATLLTVFFMSFLTSFGMAGIPSASLISLVIILNAIGIPPEGVGLVLAVERFVDMMRTTANVVGNSCSTLLIARSEDEAVLV